MKIKNKLLNILFIVITCILLLTITYSTINITIWFIDSKKTNVQINDLTDNTIIKEIESNYQDNNNVTIINPPIKNIESNKSNLYWDYIKENLIDVNFNTLLEKNNDTVLWLQVKGTNINYPVVQTNNNDFYLSHSFDKTKNSAGWVFMDFRNRINFEDSNTIIYAHGRLDNTMFGSLKNIIKSSWYNHKNNHLIKTADLSANYLWQVFSVYNIPATSDYLKTAFNSENEALDFFTMLKTRSILDFEIDLYGNDKIITLSTCYKKTDRVVLHAKLIKVEKK